MVHENFSASEKPFLPGFMEQAQLGGQFWEQNGHPFSIPPHAPACAGRGHESQALANRRWQRLDR